MIKKISHQNFLKTNFNVILISIIFYVAYALAFPLNKGRDFGTYFQYYYDIFSKIPLDHNLMLYRTPLTPLFFGVLHDLGGSLLVEISMGIAFIIMNLLIFNIVKIWNKILAYTVILLIYTNLKYNILFHSISSDSLYSFVLVSWFAFLFSISNAPSVFKFALSGLLVFLLVLTRPSSQIFVLIAILPFLANNVSLKKKLQGLFYFLLVYISLTLFYSSYNFIRYNDFTISRGTKAIIPFYRVFVNEKIVHSDNGKYSKLLANDISKYLLNQEPYKSYNIDIDTFFSGGDPRMWSDLISLSDRIYGFDTDYDIFPKVAIEAIKKHPDIYSKGVINSLETVFEVPFFLRVTSFTPSTSPSHIKYQELKFYHYQKLQKLGLPIPTEDGLIPGSYLPWTKFRPKEIEQSSITNFSFEEKKLEYPTRGENQFIKSKIVYFNKISRHFKIYLLIFFGILGNLLIRGRNERILLFFLSLILLNLIITYLGLDTILEYRIPFDTFFIIIGMIGFYNTLKYLSQPTLFCPKRR